MMIGSGLNEKPKTSHEWQSIQGCELDISENVQRAEPDGRSPTNTDPDPVCALFSLSMN